ncbi:FAD-dependent oxidoreductase [Leptospira sp. GIMC2001]|uniref:FAD-dependent oxidoreductase n=1 Tax=Leptospira sp. GIMC2001 TaxID=1513297 RepID=UPI00234B7808|nr:FAD-dependent oxidoreductase [Leptospira sp. GIMC2001]WCL48459.1 FAD-dependent oxidoreductase [Leptospira sp. GIMC2001]
MKAIIGTGISACAHASLNLEADFYDKARFPGGRMSSKPFEGKFFADIGATYFKNSVEIQKDGRIYKRSLVDWLKSKGIQAKTYSLDGNSSMSFCETGMQSIAERLLSNKTVHFRKELKKIYKTENDKTSKFQLEFTDGSQGFYDEVVITAPLPQAIELLPEGEIQNIWKEFTSPYNHYRKTLVACGYWKNLNSKTYLELLNLENKSFLRKGNDAEYISIESSKLINIDNVSQQNREFSIRNQKASPFDSEQIKDSGIVIMIQFSEKFSESYFGRWKSSSGEPTDTCYEQFNLQINKFFTGLPSPDRVRSHQWKYAQAENSMLGKTGILNLEHKNFKDYQAIVKNSGIALTGDWIYGPRIERIFMGEIERISI